MRMFFNLPQMEEAKAMEEVKVYYTKEYGSWYHDGEEGYYYNLKKDAVEAAVEYAKENNVKRVVVHKMNNEVQKVMEV